MTKTKAQKARAKAARKSKPSAQPKGRAKKWHLAGSTPWGAFSAGSGDTAQQLSMATKSVRGVRAAMPDLITNEAARLDVIVIPGTEEIGVVTAKNLFDSKPYSVQPGLPAVDGGLQVLFPRLSQIAKLYQKYRFRKLMFRYEPTVSVFAEAGKAGQLGMYMDTDALADNLTTEQAANQLSTKVRAPVNKPAALIMPTDSTYRYVRVGPVSSADIKTYDVGRFYLTVLGCDASAALADEAIGRWYVDYEIEFAGQVSAPATGPSAPLPANHVLTRLFQTIASQPSAALPMNNGQCTQLVFGGSAEINGLGVINSGGILTLPPGLYLVRARVRFTTTPNSIRAARIAIARTYPGQAEYVDDEDLWIFDPTYGYSATILVADGSLLVKAGTTARVLIAAVFGSGTVQAFADLQLALI